MARPLPFNEHELAQLSAEALLERVVIARQRGLDDEYRTALYILIYRNYDRLVAKAQMWLPEEFRGHASDVAGDAFVSAVRASFDSDSIGEFRSWLNTIVRRRCADFLRKQKPTDYLEDVEAEPSSSDDGRIDLVEHSDLIKSALPERRTHRLAVFYSFFQDKPASWVAEEINRRHAEPGEGAMTENNVHQIKSRFCRKLDELRSAQGFSDGPR